MNTKLTVKAENERILYCILNKDEDMESQLGEMLLNANGRGIGVYLEEKSIRVVDYFHAETIFSFAIISFEDTEEPVSLKWTEI